MSEPTKAIIPGSFDPITVGHADIVRRAAAVYDKVYLAVMINPNKTYMFTIEQRKKIAEAALSDIPNVEVISSEGMLWELAKSLGVCAVVKGVRNERDRAYEFEMAEFNEAHYPQGKTVLLETSEEYKNVSSTLVRERLRNSLSIDSLVTPAAADEIYKIIPQKL